MKKFIYVGICLLFWGCAKENRWDCFKSYGKQKTESRLLGSFDSVIVEDRIDLEYYYSSEQRLEVVFGENIIDLIKTEVQETVLKISNQTTCNFVRDKSRHPLVRIYSPSLSYLENRSSGDITFKDTLKGNQFVYEQWESNGVASLLVNNNITKVIMHIGFCEVIVRGSTEQSELFSAAFGKLDAKDLIANIALTNNSSVQDMTVYASEYLFAEINSRGDIRYKGEPDTVEKNRKGSGKVVSF